jgi:hypothetical protein
MRADGEPFGTSFAFLARLTEWFEVGPGRQAVLGEAKVTYRDFVNWRQEQRIKFGRANAAAVELWQDWYENDGRLGNEPAMPYTRGDEQIRLEHMEETATALVNAGLAVSAPLDEILNAVKVVYWIKEAERLTEKAALDHLKTGGLIH